jgi:type IV secretion system protein VirB8
MTSVALRHDRTYGGDQETASWFQDEYRSAVVRASRYFVLACLFGFIAITAVGAVWYLLPLRTLKPVVVTVDSRTGLVTSVQQYEGGAKLTENEAIVQSYLYRYVIARLTYDPSVDLNRNYDIVRVMTAPQAGNEFESEISNSNPRSPANLYKTSTVRSVHVWSVSPLSKDTAQVRLSTTLKRNGNPVEAEQFWVAVVRYRFTNTPLEIQQRFENPLGFQVIHFRLDQESAKSASEG